MQSKMIESSDDMGVNADVKAAVKFYEKACKMGLEVGCENAKILKR